IGNVGRITVTGGIPLTSNIIGPWAVTAHFFNTTTVEFATYIPGLGVASLANPVGNGFTAVVGTPGYDAAAIPAVDQPNQNIRLLAGGIATTSGATNSITINALNLASNQT